jgi:hypothetical protein
MSTAWAAEDLSKYRGFQFGADLATIAKQAGTDPAQAKRVHLRPALMQELSWRPRALDGSTRSEPAKQVVFSFFNGELYRIAVDYDRYETEGMKAEDFIEAISATYGTAVHPSPVKVALQGYGEQDEIIAEWHDSQYRFDLTRSSYGPTYRLVGVLIRLEAPAQAAALEAVRLDSQEAPQRDAERVSKEKEAETARLAQARLVNKPKFKP